MSCGRRRVWKVVGGDGGRKEGGGRARENETAVHCCVAQRSLDQEVNWLARPRLSAGVSPVFLRGLRQNNYDWSEVVLQEVMWADTTWCLSRPAKKRDRWLRLEPHGTITTVERRRRTF